jgi:chemotaxis protein MotD
MTKLHGTSGQLFSTIARSIGSRAASRVGPGASTAADGGFDDLLNSVSKLATQASNKAAKDGAANSGAFAQHLPPPAEHEDAKEGATDAGALLAQLAARTKRDEKDDTEHEHKDTAREPQPPAKHGPPEPAATTAEVQSRLSLPTTAGQELAAVQSVKPQAQPPAGDRKDASARSEPSSSPRVPTSAGAAKAAAANVADSAPRPVAAAQRTATMPQGDAPAPKSLSAAGPGFEAVAADVEHATKASAREALPETTKVTVVQQETHLPPVTQFSAPRQVANAVVAELKSSAPPASPAAPDLGAARSNAPDQPVKILTINLEPPDLGNVTVRLRLVGEAVSVHLAADRKDTSQMLDQQRGSIREMMQSAGYVADVAPVQHGALDGFRPGSGQAQGQHQSQPQPSFSGQQQSSSGQGASDGFGASSGQPQGGANQAQDQQQANQETRHEQDVAPRTRRGPVYL